MCSPSSGAVNQVRGLQGSLDRGCSRPWGAGAAVRPGPDAERVKGGRALRSPALPLLCPVTCDNITVYLLSEEATLAGAPPSLSASLGRTVGEERALRWDISPGSSPSQHGPPAGPQPEPHRCGEHHGPRDGPQPGHGPRRERRRLLLPRAAGGRRLRDGGQHRVRLGSPAWPRAPGWGWCQRAELAPPTLLITGMTPAPGTPGTLLITGSPPCLRPQLPVPQEVQSVQPGRPGDVRGEAPHGLPGGRPGP